MIAACWIFRPYNIVGFDVSEEQTTQIILGKKTHKDGHQSHNTRRKSPKTCNDLKRVWPCIF